MTSLTLERVYVCESAATGDDWRDGRRQIEQFPSYMEAWERMNEHLRRGRRAFCSTSVAFQGEHTG